MPTARGSFVAGIVGQVIYAIGGYSGIELSTNEAYNIAKDSWSTAPPMPTPGRGSRTFSWRQNLRGWRRSVRRVHDR